MADEITQTNPWVRIEELLRARDVAALQALLDELPPADVTRAISRLEDEHQAQLLTLLHPEDAAELLEDLPDIQSAGIIEEIPAETAAAIVEELDSDHRADVLSELDTDDAHAILEQMAPEEAADARRLLRYDANTAGGLMITEFLVYPQTLTVADVLNDMRANAEEYSDYSVQYAYVRSEGARLVGVLRLRDLVLSRGTKPLNELMIVNPISVFVDTPLDELEQTFDRYQFSALPVIDRAGAMLGVLQRSDMEEAATERAEKIFMRWSGIFGHDELRHLPLATRSLGRVWWLVLNLALSFVSASIIVLFEGTIQDLIALAAIMTVQSNVCGISGNQAVAVSIREMTLGLIHPRDLVRVMSKELTVGLVNGLAIGLLLGGIIYLWQQDLAFAAVVAVALNLNMVIAVILGGCIPLIARRMGFDPAVASPMITTVMDMCGFFLTLGMASLLLLWRSTHGGA